MGRHPDIADMCVGLRVDDSNFPIALPCVFSAVADVNQLGVRIVDDAVGSVLELDRSDGLECFTSKYSEHPVVAAYQI